MGSCSGAAAGAAGLQPTGGAGERVSDGACSKSQKAPFKNYPACIAAQLPNDYTNENQLRHQLTAVRSADLAAVVSLNCIVEDRKELGL